LLLKFLLPSLERFPMLVPLLIGVLAGLCEETLFRGPIQAGLLRRIPKSTAIVIGALLFAAAHLDLYGLPIRTLLGVLLGWMVVRNGSVFPAMVTHASYDITQLLHLSTEVRNYGGTQGLLDAMHAGHGEPINWLLIVGGAILAALGLSLVAWSGPRNGEVAPEAPAPILS
jgi:membrane protease YdiL (CAAX protease family)